MGIEKRPPHPATVVQRREAHPATVVPSHPAVAPRAPHPATVVQGRGLPPHPATVVQARTPPAEPSARPPHPALVGRVPAPSSIQPMQAEPGSVRVPAPQGGTVEGEDHCHLRGMRMSLRGVGVFDGVASNRTSFAQGGSLYYDLKRKRFLFKQIRAGRYEVTVNAPGSVGDARQQSVLVDVTNNGLVKLAARFSHHPPSGLTLTKIKAARTLPDVSMVDKAEPDLSGVKPLRDRSAPTRVYLMAHEREARPKTGRRRKLEGPVAVWRNHPYLSQYDLPLEALLQRETQYLKSHVVLYTGMRFDLILLHAVWAELVRQGVAGSGDYEGVRWFRNPLQASPAKHTFYDVRDFLAAHNNRINDNDAKLSWVLQSCNAHVFGNTLVNSEESTADFYWDGMAVNHQNIADRLDSTLDLAELFVGGDCAVCRDKRADVVQRLSDLLDAVRPTTHPKGMLFQMFIPHAIVNEVAYMTRTVMPGEGSKRTNGQPDLDLPDCLATLLKMQTRDGPALDHYEALQVRLYLPRVLLPDSGVILYEYSNTDPGAMETFRGKVAMIVAEILAFVAKERQEYLKVAS